MRISTNWINDYLLHIYCEGYFFEVKFNGFNWDIHHQGEIIATIDNPERAVSLCQQNIVEV